MPKYSDLKALAEIRLKEARTLHRNKLYDGSAYLCGYVVELALKARICKHLNIPEYPDSGDFKLIFSSHDFDRLLLLSGLQKDINIANITNKKLYTNWLLLTQWKPEQRYQPIGSYSQAKSRELIQALTSRRWGFYKWITTIW